MTNIQMLQCKFPIRVGNESADAAIILSPVNRDYFTGIRSSYGFLIVTKHQAYQLVDFRYFEIASQSHVEAVLIDDLPYNIKSIVRELDIKNILLESKITTVNQADTLKNICNDIGINIIKGNALDNTIDRMRMIKTDEEIRKIAKSQELTDAAFNYILPRISESVTERDIALDIEFFMRKNGAEKVAFDLIVASGKNGSLPHAEASNKKILKGDFITMDIGARLDGYNSDMTRTVALGCVDSRQREIYNIVLNAQNAAISCINSGNSCNSVDRAARDIIEKSNFKDCFGHATGHSVGMEIHEFPVFSEKCHEHLQNNMILTVEPGIYLKGEMGVRIEDMIVVKDNAPMNLTSSPKQLIVI